ncbi:hypothetical protein LCGC14_0719600, partial [marine sediment metagenome]
MEKPPKIAIHSPLKFRYYMKKKLSMILFCLRKVGVEPTDKIIVACDYGRSWRKALSKEYKADRKEQRDKHTD